MDTDPTLIPTMNKTQGVWVRPSWHPIPTRHTMPSHHPQLSPPVVNGMANYNPRHPNSRHSHHVNSGIRQQRLATWLTAPMQALCPDLIPAAHTDQLALQQF